MSHNEVATIGRAMRALEYLAEEAMTVSDLSRRLEVDRGTGSRLLATMESAGYVVRDASSGHYTISASKIISLYGLVEGRTELTQLARPILAELRDLTNETANLGVLSDDEIVVIAMERSRAMLSASVGLGRHVGVHCTALGKAFVAFLPDQRLSEILTRKGQVAITPRTITSTDGLRAHLERVRHLGYAVDDEESEYEVRCVAAPVRAHTGRVIASLGIIGPSARITLKRAHELSEPVIDAAKRLSIAIGWDPHSSEPSRCAAKTEDEGSAMAAATPVLPLPA